MQKNNFLIFVWGLYDLANQFFALNVVSLYFVQWITIEKGLPEIFYSISFGVSVLLVALAAPILGSISDAAQRRQPFLIGFTLISVIFTAFLGGVSSVWLALIFFAIANLGCQGGIIFYNALMTNITPEGKIGFVSGVGKMLGYCGAMIGLVVMKPIVKAYGNQAVFLPTAILFLLFSLPCMIFIKDNSNQKLHFFASLNMRRVKEVSVRIRDLLFDASSIKGLSNFLKASFFGLCVLNVIILFMSVYARKVLGLNHSELTSLLMFSTLFAIAGSFFSGQVSDKIGYKRSFAIIFVLWMICLLSGAIIQNKIIFWAVGALVGVSLGATWVVSRAMVVYLVPAERTGEIFGLFNLIGYGAGIVGAMFWGLILLVLAPFEAIGYRIALLSLNGFLIAGLIFSLRIESD